MSNRLVSFALAKSIYCEKKNYLDTFSPFILKVLSEGNHPQTLNQIDNSLIKFYDLKIPVNTLKSILSLLNNHKLITLEKFRKEYRSTITKDGQEFVERSTESERHINRRLQEFWNSFVIFAKDKYKIDYQGQDLEKIVIAFINDNIIDLISYTLDSGAGNLLKSNNNKFDQHFSHFIFDIEKNNSALFSIFQEILKGSILWNEIATKSNVEKETEFGNLTLYLDTNYLVSLFELDSPFATKAAKQLFDLLRRNNKLILKVLTITLDEIKRLLIEYKRQRNNYYDIPVNDVYYFLRKNNYDDAKIDLLIANLVKKCREYGIGVDEIAPLDLSKANDTERDLYDELYRGNMSTASKSNTLQRTEESIHQKTLHDVSVILQVQKRRGCWPQSLEDSKVTFLTSSTRLDNFVRKRSKKKGTFPETILDLTLTNILWLKNPANDIGCSIQHIMSIHAKNIFVDHGIWKRFISIVNELKENNDINDEDYAYLISNNQITKDYLNNIEPNKIDHENVLEILNKILASDIIKKEELNEAKNKLKIKDEKIQQMSRNESTLQSRLDKTQYEFEEEKSKSRSMQKELDELKRLFNEKEQAEIKRERIQIMVNDEIIKLKSEFKKVFLYFVGLMILNAGLLLLANYLFQTNLVLSIFISAFLLITSGIIINKASSKEYSKLFKLIFMNKALRAELMQKCSDTYDRNSILTNN